MGKYNHSKFRNACDDIIIELECVTYEGDLSDIGNHVGVIIAKYFDENNIGFNKEAFLGGLDHGISITDGTHG